MKTQTKIGNLEDAKSETPSLGLQSTKVASEKVANMVGTFLKEGSTGSSWKQPKACLKERLAILTRLTASCGRQVQVVSECIRVPATKTEPEKVDTTVTTFLPEDIDGFQVSTTKVASQKVTNMVGTFLNGDIHNNEIPGIQDISRHI